MITESCADCSNDHIKKLRGCEQPTQTPVWVADEYEFYICPIQWITPQITTWSRKYRYIKDNICNSINYDNSNPKFLEAIEIYEKYLHEFREDKQKSDKQEKSFKKLKEAKLWQKK